MTATDGDGSDATSDTTVGRVLATRAMEQGSQAFVVTEHECLTYADAERRSRTVARALLAVGAGRGTRIALLYPAGIAFIVAWLATVRIGAVAIPVSTFVTADELRALLSESDASLLLGVRSHLRHDYCDTLEAALPGFALADPTFVRHRRAPALQGVYFADAGTRVHVARSFDALLSMAETVDSELLEAIEHDVSPEDRLLMIYTSGSTAAPKGVVHQHGEFLRHNLELNRIRGLTPDMKLFSNSPIFWVGGVGFNVAGTLATGATLVCPTSSDPEQVLDLLERERPELVNGYEHSVAKLVVHPTFGRRDFSFINSGNLFSLMPVGRKPADPGLRHSMFGTTETGSVCLMSGDESDQPESRRGSFGKPVPGVEARVIDPETFLDCQENQLGEMWLRGRILMEGYYGRERGETFTADQWYRTGDLFETDHDGFFYFKGRRGDMIKTSGANVSPREVEAALRDVTGLDAVVLGIPDETRGQIVVAVVVSSDDASVDLDSVTQALRSKLSAYKMPRKMICLTREELPVLSSGKADVRRLTEVFRSA